MRVLSTKLNMTEEFAVGNFYEVIVKWLKAAGPCKPIGVLFEESNTKENIHLEESYCTIDTFVVEKATKKYYLFKLEHVFHEQTWTTEIIFADNIKEVYFHIDCSRDATRFEEVPDIRSDVIRTFVNSCYLKQTELPIIEQPLNLTSEIEPWLIKAIKGRYDLEMPLIWVAQYYDSMGFAVNEDTLAKKLAGIAYVAVFNIEDTRVIQSKAKKRAPYNGTVAIYCKGGKERIFRKEDSFYGKSLDGLVLSEVERFVTAKVDADAPTWKQLYTEKVQAEAQEKSELLDEAFDENGTLEEQLKKARERIAILSDENYSLKAKNEGLELALANNQSNYALLSKSDICEFFDGEQYDLVVGLLTKALRDCSPEHRDYELLVDILAKNPLKGNGKEILKVVKEVLSTTGVLKDSDFGKLKAAGFDVIAEQNHYKIRFKGDDKYQFTVFKTPSDSRGGKNLVSDITKVLSVYK